jgi:putative tryptophan/tyrosine transport system substrate-binding protein
MLQKIALARVVVFGLCLLALGAHAQKAAKVWRIGYLASSPPLPGGSPPVKFREAMRELGYVEDQNVVYIGRWANARTERLPALAAELVGAGVDVIVTFGGKAAEVAKQTTSTVPIVFVGTGDPVATGMVESLSRPGANATGLSDQSTELSAKRLEILKELVPKAERIAVLWNADDYAMTLRYREIERAAALLHVTVRPVTVRRPEDFEQAFAAMTHERPEALLLLSDSLTLLNRKRILEFAETSTIPTMYEIGSLVQDGGLISYGPNLEDILIRSAVYVDKILKGARPRDLPVEQPTRYYLLVNVKAATALRLTIPQSLLLRADEAIR